MEFSSSSSDEDGDDDEVFGERSNYGKRVLENYIYSGGNLIDFSSSSSDEDGDGDEVFGETSNYGKRVLENYIYSGGNLIDFSSSSSDEDGDDDEHKRKSVVGESSNSGGKNNKNLASRIVRRGSHLHLPSSTSSSGSHLYLPSSSSSSDDDEHKRESVVGEGLNYGNNSGKNSKNLASGIRVVRGVSSPSSGKDGKKNTGFLKATKEKERVEDEECVILDYDPLHPPTIDFKDKLFISDHHHHPFGFEDGELIIISERGKGTT